MTHVELTVVSLMPGSLYCISLSSIIISIPLAFSFHARVGRFPHMRFPNLRYLSLSYLELFPTYGNKPQTMGLWLTNTICYTTTFTPHRQTYRISLTTVDTTLQIGNKNDWYDLRYLWHLQKWWVLYHCQVQTRHFRSYRHQTIFCFRTAASIYWDSYF